MWQKIIEFFQRLFSKTIPSSPPPIEGAVKVTPTKYEKLLAKALSQVGQREISGSADNKQILEYFTATHFEPEPGEKLHDEVPWCAAFANWCLREIGEKGTGSAAAASFDTWGVRLEKPIPGCIVCIEHLDEFGKKNHKRHVTIYKGNQDICVGGNQGNMVCVKSYVPREINQYRGFA